MKDRGDVLRHVSFFHQTVIYHYQQGIENIKLEARNRDCAPVRSSTPAFP
jgi:hypothetical protein